MEEENPTPESGASNGRSRTPLIIGGIVILALVLVGLSLPPISIWDRFGSDSADSGEEIPQLAATAEAPETTDAGSESAATNAQSIPGEVTLAVTDGSANVASVSAADYAATSNLPSNVAAVGNVYTVDGSGNGRAALAIPAGEDTRYLDMYGYDGSAWNFVPSSVNATTGEMISEEGPLPQAFVIAKANGASGQTVASELLPTQELPAEVTAVLTELSLGTLTLALDADNNVSLQGMVVASDAATDGQFVRVTNTGAVVDSNSLSALLGDAGQQTAVIANLIEQSAGYAGVNLDLQGVNPAQTINYSAFINNVADALHSQGQQLAITLATPQFTSNGWNTGGQDWASLGQSADIVYLRLPLDPTAYTDNGLADQLLQWATKRIDRNRITAVVTAGAVDGIGEAYLPMTNAQALFQLGMLEYSEGSSELLPGDVVEVAFSGDASPLEWDGSSLTYKFTYDRGGQVHTAWLGSEAALAHRTHLANNHHLRGISVQGLADVDNGAGYVAALQSFLGTADAPSPAGAAIVWTVRDGEDKVIASDTGDALSFGWTETGTGGIYSINADFAFGDTTLALGMLPVTVMGETDDSVALGEAEVEEEAATDESESTEEESAADETTDETTTEETTDESTTEEITEETTEETPPATFDPGDADAVVNVNANLRSGPGLGYPVVSGTTPNTAVALIGRSSDSSWYQIVTPANEEAWIYGQLVTVNSSFEVASLPVPNVAPPVIADSGGDGGDGGGGSPPPVVPPANVGGSFEIGGQSHSFANPTLMAYAGMNWIKFQHKWGVGDNPDAVLGRIQQAHANGFKVLLSIPGSDHSSIDYGAYAAFVGGVAALGPDAIEIWNEMNIDREWPSGQIDPATYVNQMLAPAYNAIKAANPNVMVISGAPAPTGFFGGCSGGGCNDDLYMAGMAAAGGANYMDCIGIHYNEGIISPTQSSGDPRNPSNHYTRYYSGMVNTYWNAFGGSRPLCFTELGYLSGDDYGGVPGGFAWAGSTSISEHATWLAEAVSIASNSSQVRMLIVFNVDFTHYSEDPQAGFAMIRKDGSCPACETLHQVTGGR